MDRQLKLLKQSGVWGSHVPGSAFGSEGEGFLRVSFCADLPVLTEGVSVWP